MATVPVTALIPILFFGVIAVIIVLSILSSSRSMKLKKSYYNNPQGYYQNPNPNATTIPSQPQHERYVPGEFSHQMELDMRLPYRRFKKLYPGSNITYQEYKNMQMKSAFRRSMSSQENKRMVR